MRHLSEYTINTANKLGIQFPTPLPLFRGSPNLEHLADWAESQITPMARKIAHKVIENLQYIPFEDFLRQLQKTIDDFHQRVGTNPYVLLVGELRPYKLAHGCSDLWVIGLALEYCGLKEPDALLTPEQLLTYRHTHPTVTYILMLDDASYSGAQKGQMLDYFRDKETMKTAELSFYVGIPFMTQHAEERLSSRGDMFHELFFLKHMCMPSVLDVLDAKEVFYLKSAHIGYTNPGHTVTFFDHVLPDFFSFFQPIYLGSNLLASEITVMHFQGYTYDSEVAKTNKNIQLITDTEQYNTLACSLVAPNYGLDCSGYTIPKIIQPYQLHKAETRTCLNYAMGLGKVGNRTSYPARDPNVEVMLSKPISSSPRLFHYKKPTWALEIQIGYDNAVMFGNQDKITYIEQVEMQKKHQQVQHELKTAFPILKPRKTEPTYSYMQHILSALVQLFNIFMVITGLRFLLCMIQKAIYSDASIENHHNSAPCAH